MKAFFTASLLILSICLSGCMAARSAFITGEGFERAEMGLKIKDMEKQFGHPFAIHAFDQKKEVYEYIERIHAGEKIVEFRRYYFIVENGKVVGKYIRFSNVSPFEDQNYPGGE